MAFRYSSLGDVVVALSQTVGGHLKVAAIGCTGAGTVGGTAGDPAVDSGNCWSHHSSWQGVVVGTAALEKKNGEKSSNKKSGSQKKFGNFMTCG